MMSRFKMTALLAALLALSACAEKKEGPRYGYRADNRSEYRTADRSLDGPQTVELVSGNTVIGHYSVTEGTFIDYFAPDGRLVSREPDGMVYQGTWSARYTQFCTQHDNPARPHQYCFDVFETDGRYSWFRPGGQGFYDVDSIAPGNVKSLPLE